MKNLLCLFFIIFGQALLAQKFNDFYIEPTLTTKLTTNRAANLPEPLVGQYFKVTAKQNIYDANVFIGLGLNLGYCFKNNDKLQFGFNGDEVIQGFEAVGKSVVTFTPDVLYGNTKYKGHGGTACTSFNLVYKRSVLNIKSNWFNQGRFVRVHFNFGISYLYKHNNGLESFTGIDGITFTAPDSSRISITSEQWNFPQSFKRSFKGILGLDFTFGKNDRERFSLNVSFITNKGGDLGAKFGYTDIEVEVTKNNKTQKYGQFIYGSGNGIYFTLSKRLYPIRWRNERIARRMEKLKS